MDVVPKVSSTELGWGLAGAGLVAGIIVIPKLPQVIGTYTSLVAGVALIFVSIKYIKNHDAAAFGFGVGFALALDGVVRIVMPSTAQAASASFLSISV